MRSGNFPDIPSADDLDIIGGAIESGRHDFWSLVDSSSSSYATRCTCDGNTRSRDCERWDHRRDGEWCIASNSYLDRCSQHTYSTTPFCHFHLSRAWEVLIHAADVDTRRRLENRRQLALEEHDRATETLLLSQGVVRDQQWDAATAASQLRERVYFFLVADAVKIGRSVRPEQRVKTLKGVKMPEGLDLSAGRLLGTIPGGHHVESSLHNRFGRHHLVGEWFAYPPIAEQVADLLTEPVAEVAS